MKRRCVVSKEIEYTDANAGEVLNLLRAGFNIEWKDGPVPRPSANGEATAIKKVRRGRRRVNLTPTEVQELVALRKKGCSSRTLARKFRMSISGVRNALHRHSKGKGGESE